MKREMKDYLLVRISGFRRMVKRKQILDILQFGAWAFVLYENFWELRLSGGKVIFCSLITLVSIILHIIRRDKFANIVELVLDTLYFFLFMVIFDCFSIGAMISFLIHLLRIESCYTDEKMKTLYGYPKFVPFYVDNAFEKDDRLACSVKNEYDEIMEDKIVRFSSAISRCDWILQFTMILSVIFAAIGCVVLGLGIKEQYFFSKAVSVEDIGSCQDGDVISGIVYQVYDQSSIASQKSVRENYIAEFGGKLVSFSAPYPYKEEFERLYKDTESALKNGEMSTNHDSFISADGIVFHGRYLKADKKIKLLDTSKWKLGEDHPEVEENYFIEIVDIEKAELNVLAGIVMILLGIVAFVFVGLFVLKKIDDFDNTVL